MAVGGIRILQTDVVREETSALMTMPKTVSRLTNLETAIQLRLSKRLLVPSNISVKILLEKKFKKYVQKKYHIFKIVCSKLDMVWAYKYLELR